MIMAEDKSKKPNVGPVEAAVSGFGDVITKLIEGKSVKQLIGLWFLGQISVVEAVLLLRYITTFDPDGTRAEYNRDRLESFYHIIAEDASKAFSAMRELILGKDPHALDGVGSVPGLVQKFRNWLKEARARDLIAGHTKRERAVAAVRKFSGPLAGILDRGMRAVMGEQPKPAGLLPAPAEPEVTA